MKKPTKKVIISMSGGVDSSVAAALLKDQGYDPIGIFMHFWAEETKELDGITNKCCSLESFNDARRVAQQLDFPIYTINLDQPFKEKVVDSFLCGYQQGETPNPCVNCNKFIKFDLLLKKADALGVDLIATGHYAKISAKDRSVLNGKKPKTDYHIFRPKDLNKDQTYFLYNLNQDNLSRILFPLSGLTKPQVRELAKKFRLDIADKPESQEICFIPGKTHNDFLKKHLRLIPGQIKTLDNQILGEHQGLPLYTIGQRKGVEIGGIGPFYVAKFDYGTNTLYVVNDGEDASIYGDKLMAKDVNWISGQEPKLPFKCEAVIRYRHLPVECIITKDLNDNLIASFTKPQRAITKGQSVVFYQKNEVLGGGIIK